MREIASQRESHLEDVNESGVVVEREAGLAARLRPVHRAWLADRGSEEPEGQVRCRHGVDVPGVQFNRNLGFRVQIRDKFGDNFSTRALQVLTCLKIPNMIRDRFGDVPKIAY